LERVEKISATRKEDLAKISGDCYLNQDKTIDTDRNEGGLRVNRLNLNHRQNKGAIISASYYPHFPLINSVAIHCPSLTSSEKEIMLSRQFVNVGDFLYTGTKVTELSVVDVDKPCYKSLSSEFYSGEPSARGAILYLLIYYGIPITIAWILVSIYF
jgi:hypothetical protein